MSEKQTALELYFLRKNDKFVDLHLSDYILTHIYSKVVFQKIEEKWETLPPYIKKEVPYAIRLKAFSGRLKDSESFLSEYWLRQSVQVLSAYERAFLPYSTDLRADVELANLLSLKGFEELRWAKRALAWGQSGHKTTLKAMKSSNKFLLNRALFKNFDLLKGTTFYSRPQFGQIILSVSSGCYNMCSHCAYNAKAPVTHMPYPVFIQLVHLFGRNLRSVQNGGAQFYSDSDPVAYRDKIVNADFGDICRYVQTEIAEGDRLAATFVSKGVLQQGDEFVISKAFECNPVSLSFVDLPGEKNVEKNKLRIQRSLDALRRVPQDRKGKNFIDFRHLCLSQNQFQNLDFDLPEDAVLQTINPVFNGRWVETCFTERLSEGSRGRRNGFSSYPNIIIKPDGAIYECALKQNGFDFLWKRLGNIFEFVGKERS